jgi:ribosomal protein L16 Arg81 hydroxylase
VNPGGAQSHRSREHLPAAEYQQLLDDLGAAAHAHSDGSLSDHLIRTYQLLKSWDEPEDVSSAGLFHSIYGTEWYRTETAPMARRESVRTVIGRRAETLAFLFCVCARGEIWKPGASTLTNRLTGELLTISPEIRRDLIQIDVANTVEQLRRGVGADRGVLERFYSRVESAGHVISPAALGAARGVLRQYPGIAPGRHLEELLAPIAPQTFVKDYWGKKPVHIVGHGKNFTHLFSLERLQEILTRATGLNVRASFDGGRTHVHVLPAEAWSLFQAGATLCISDIAAADEGLASFAAAVRHQLNFTGRADCRAYLSPEGQGYAVHYDARVATTLQIEGRKRWRVSREVALPWPHYQVRSGNGDSLVTDHVFQDPPQDWERFRPPSDCTFDEILLEPGDVLCLPSGTWHSAAAQGYSLAINLAFEPSGMWDLLAPALERTLLRSEQWRGPLPCAPSSGIHCGPLPDDIRSFCNSRLRELVQLLHAMIDDGSPIDQAWHRKLVFSELRPEAPVHGPQRPPQSDRLQPDQCLRVTRRGPLAYGFGPGASGERLVYLYGDNPRFEIGYSLEAAPFFTHLLAQSDFRAQDARHWTDDGSQYSWEAARAMLEDMIEHGVVESV